MSHSSPKGFSLLRLALLCGACLSLSFAARAEVVERIAAVVNDEVILYSELLDQAQSFEALYSALPEGAERQAKRREVLGRVLDELIDQRRRHTVYRKEKLIQLHLAQRLGKRRLRLRIHPLPERLRASDEIFPQPRLRLICFRASS